MAVGKFYKDINLNGNQLLNAGLEKLSAPPTPGTQGRIFYNTTSARLCIDNGSSIDTYGFGTVTSVGITGPSIFNYGSAVTGSGNLSLSLASQSPYTVFAAPSGGGTPSFTTIDHNWISDFNTAVRANTLNQMASPVGPVAFNNQKITGLADPISSQDAATKKYVDSAIQGLQVKPTADLATTAALPSCTYANGVSGVGATLTGTSNGALSAIDGITPTVGMVILVKDQATAAQNGLYTVTAVGSAGAQFVLTRHVDMDEAAEFSGAFIPVSSQGTANKNSLWIANPSGTVTVGTTSIPLQQLDSAADFTAGSGISISGNTISISASYTGQTSITTVGTIASGTWQGAAVAVGYGGTGASTAAGARANLGALTRVTGTLNGNGSTTVFTATHNLNSTAVHVTVFDSTGAQVEPDIQNTSVNATTITFSPAPANASSWTWAAIG
jgi:hypothetical protein